MFQTICDGKLAISSTIFLMSSAIIRIMAAGCFGLAFYVKYSAMNVIGDEGFAALDTIDLYGMPLGTYIQGLAFGSITVFLTEIVCGIWGFVSGVKRKQSYLMVYICLCFAAILVYITHMVFWSILHAKVNDGSIKAGFHTYYKRYQNAHLTQYYDDKWKEFYTHFTCCGSTGNNNCREYIGTFNPGCFDKFAVRMKSYIQIYLSIFSLFIVFQVVNIVAADYTLIKLQLKVKKKQISDQKKYILCIGDYGLFPTFWGFLKQFCIRSRMCLFSVLIKLVNIVSCVALISISIRFISSDFISTVQLLPLFRRMYIHGYSYHDISAGFGSSILAIGCLGVCTGTIGLIGSKIHSTVLQTVSFFLTVLLIKLKTIAGVFWSVMYIEFVTSNEDKLNAYVRNLYTNVHAYNAINRLMVNFKCCEIDSQTSNTRQFCISDMHESLVDFNFNYHTSYASINGLYGNFNGSKKCSTAVEDSIMVYTVVFLTLMSLGIVLDIFELVFTSKEFKEAQIKQHANNTSIKQIEGKHLIPWLLYIYNKEKRRNLYVMIYIIITVFMLMLELSFIVLAAIFSLSYHVNRDYIDAIGDFYTILAISGIVLVSSSMIVRIIGLVGTFNKFKKTVFASTALMALIALLNLAYIIMTSILRHDKYPCSYTDLTNSYVSHDCSSELASTSGVAIGMFAIELVTQIVHLAGFIYDIKANLAKNRVKNLSFPLLNNTTTRSLDDRNVLSETNFD